MSSLDPLTSNLFSPKEFSNEAIDEEEFNNFMDFAYAAVLGTEILTTQEQSSIQTLQNWQQRVKTNVLDKYTDEELVYCDKDSENKKITFKRLGTKSVAQEPAMFNIKKNQLRLIKEFSKEAHEQLGENFQIEMLNDNGEVIRSGISLGKPIEAREMREFERAYIIYYTATNILKTRKEKSANNNQDKSTDTNKSPYQTKTSPSYNKKEISEKDKIEYDDSSRIKSAENEKNLLRFKNIIQENEIASEKKHIMKKICKSKDECFEKIQLITKNKNEKAERSKDEILSSEFKTAEEEKTESFHNKTFTIPSQGDFSTVSIEENCDGKISKVFQESISDI